MRHQLPHYKSKDALTDAFQLIIGDSVALSATGAPITVGGVRLFTGRVITTWITITRINGYLAMVS